MHSHEIAGNQPNQHIIQVLLISKHQNLRMESLVLLQQMLHFGLRRLCLRLQMRTHHMNKQHIEQHRWTDARAAHLGRVSGGHSTAAQRQLRALPRELRVASWRYLRIQRASVSTEQRRIPCISSLSLSAYRTRTPAACLGAAHPASARVPAWSARPPFFASCRWGQMCTLVSDGRFSCQSAARAWRGTRGRPWPLRKRPPAPRSQVAGPVRR